jgi:precorrin-2 dehydrogenase / sirohydrochlorin ferrochelatase
MSVAFGFPVSLELSGRRAVVIGSLPVREGKVEALLAGGATDVMVIATAPAGRLEELASIEGVRVERRKWAPEDLDGAFVCIGWAADQASRDAITRSARDRGVLVNVVDDIPNCDWAMPSIVRRGELILAISSGGASPALTKRLRVRLEQEFGEEWAEVLTVLRAVREETMPLLPDLAERSRRWATALDPEEAAAMIRGGRPAELHDLLRERLLEGVSA